MQISTLKEEVTGAALEFAWSQWAQLGLLADESRHDRWVADPEALLAFSLEVSRSDPRLFDELLDWLVTNWRLISVQRLNNLSDGDEQRALLDAALAWVSRHRSRRGSTGSAARRSKPRDEPKSLFSRSQAWASEADEVFLEHGFLRGRADPSGKSRHPDLAMPIAFGFRLRQLLGLGARSEVIRFLLTTEEPRVTVAVVTRTAGYAKRNVHEALASLRDAGVVDVVTVANEQRYGIDRIRWATLLGLDGAELPVHRDWPQLLRAAVRLIRWLNDPRQDDLSEYMRASQARVLMTELEPDLAYAGVRVRQAGGVGAEYWPSFVAAARELVATLASP